MNNKAPLFQPITIGNLLLKNRIVMAPMTRSRANTIGNIPRTDCEGDYYEQRASAGLIISEGSQVSPRAVGYINTPGIYSDEQVTAWKEVTQKVHDKGGKIFIQLWHVGRISHPTFHNGKLPLAPSAINPNVKSFTFKGFEDTVTPKEMSIKDIQNTINEFVNAAKNAIDAGFDGVEIHTSNGYLFHQFFTNCSNTRKDNYGGSIENNSRFLFEVLNAVKNVIPENCIGIRLNPSLHGLAGIEMDEMTIPTFDYIIKKLNEYDLAYLHLSEPFTDVSTVPFAEPNIAQRYRPVYNGNLMINTGFNLETGNEILKNGLADMVAFGKLFISNPDLVARYKNNSKLNNWDANTFYTTGKKGYLDYSSMND